MQASVVINTYNKGGTLARVLEALERQEGVAPESFEVVVRDDGSSDDTWSRLQGMVPRWGGRLVCSRGENTGVSEARNIGVREARGEIVIILADDIVAGPRLVAEHLRRQEMERPDGPCAVVGRVLWPPELDHDPFRHWLDHGGPQFAYWRIKDTVIGPRFFYACNIAARRDLFLAHPFDPAIRYGYEDTELGLRLQRAGVRLLYHPAAWGHHHHPRSIEEFRQRQYRVGRSLYAALRNHPEMAAEVPPPVFPLRRRMRLALRWLTYPAARLAGPRVPLALHVQQRYWRTSLHRALVRGFHDARREDPNPPRW
ncbi:MAG TPA: glycosyltransferase [Candidatus Polarisedimenticolia bacterium]|nr:glycosyltransferase [Candidatus Polarisedimenticolia bacterium]